MATVIKMKKRGVVKTVRKSGLSLEQDICNVFVSYVSDPLCLSLVIFIFTVAIAADVYLIEQISYVTQSLLGDGKIHAFIMNNLQRTCGFLVLTAASYAGSKQILPSSIIGVVISLFMRPSSNTVYASMSLVLLVLRKSRHNLVKTICVVLLTYTMVKPFVDPRWFSKTGEVPRLSPRLPAEQSAPEVMTSDVYVPSPSSSTPQPEVIAEEFEDPGPDYDSDLLDRFRRG